MGVGWTAAGDGSDAPGASVNLCVNMDVSMASVWDQTGASATRGTRAKHVTKILMSVG